MKFEISNINIITPDFGVAPNDFWLNIEIDISEIGGYGAETFNANIASVERLKRITESGCILGKGMIICKDYNEIAVQNIIETLVSKIAANSWDEFCIEFEKYFDRL